MSPELILVFYLKKNIFADLRSGNQTTETRKCYEKDHFRNTSDLA